MNFKNLTDEDLLTIAELAMEEEGETTRDLYNKSYADDCIMFSVVVKERPISLQYSEKGGIIAYGMTADNIAGEISCTNQPEIIDMVESICQK